MDTITYLVDRDNIMMVAEVLVNAMRGQTFVMTIYVEEPVVVENLPRIGQLRLYDGPRQPLYGYILNGGQLTIPLNQNKKLYWDLSEEQVEVNIFTRGRGFITIKKTHPVKGERTVLMIF